MSLCAVSRQYDLCLVHRKNLMYDAKGRDDAIAPIIDKVQ